MPDDVLSALERALLKATDDAREESREAHRRTIDEFQATNRRMLRAATVAYVCGLALLIFVISMSSGATPTEAADAAVTVIGAVTP